MKWFKRRAPVVVVRDDALANYFKEERQRKEDEEQPSKKKNQWPVKKLWQEISDLSLLDKPEKSLGSALENNLDKAFFKFSQKINEKNFDLLERTFSAKDEKLEVYLYKLWKINVKFYWRKSQLDNFFHTPLEEKNGVVTISFYFGSSYFPENLRAEYFENNRPEYVEMANLLHECMCTRMDLEIDFYKRFKELKDF